MDNNMYEEDKRLNQEITASFKIQLLRFTAAELAKGQGRLAYKRVFETERGGPDRLSNEEMYEIFEKGFPMENLPGFDSLILDDVLYAHYYVDYGQDRRANVFDDPKGKVKHRKFFEIDRQRWLAEVKEHLGFVEQRDQLIENIGSQLLEQGISYDIAFEKILGIKQIESAVLSRD